MSDQRYTRSVKLTQNIIIIKTLKIILYYENSYIDMNIV